MKLSVGKYLSHASAGCLTIAVLVLTASNFKNAALACGPFFDQTVFSLSMHPDPPFKLYAKGLIGIVHPTYDHSYQIVAFRYLSGRPLTAAEQTAYVKYWHNHYDGASNDDPQASANWLKDRAKIGGALDQTRTYTDVYRSATPDGWSNYLNCPAGAFTTASATLARLVVKYGADSPICKEWLKGQDAVFCHCQSPGYDYKANKPNIEPGFPENLPDSALLELRQDRQYQMAAAFFYAQRLDDALSLFTAISEDKTSQWQTIAKYMVARTLIRMGTLSKKEGYETESLAKALALLKQLSSNPDFISFKKSIDDLIDFTQLRLDPIQSSQALSKQLASAYAGNDLSRKIDNYLFVMSNPFAKTEDKNGETSDRKPKVTDAQVVSISNADELTSWIGCFTSSDKSVLASAAKGFRTHHNLAWAIAYASKLRGSEADSLEVVSVLSKVAKSDPGFISASYYRARLLLGSKHTKEADDVIAAALASSNLTPSAANDLAGLQLDRATTLEQFFSLSFRPPATTLSGSDTQETPDSYEVEEKKTTFAKNPLVLLPQAAAVINSAFPLSSFVIGVYSKHVAAGYVKQFAQAAFTRAVMLGDTATALKMTPILKNSYPAVAREIIDFERATIPTDREFAAVCLMLKCPGIRPTVTGGTSRGTAIDRIDDFQDNWWDKSTFTDSGDRGGGQQDDPAKASLATAFLSAADRTLAKTQLSKLQALGEAPNYLGKIVIAYARTHPSDPRVPEALALTVKATHFGSSDQSKTTAVSTQAFQVLHRSYPGNQWTKRTPYHY